MVGFSLTSFFGSFVRIYYLSAGLRPHSVAVDADTTIHCWIPPSLVPSEDSKDSTLTNSTAPIPAPKPPLLLIHGFGPQGTWQWRRQVRTLTAHFDLIVPDLVFFGGSTSRSPLRSEAFQAEALGRLVDALVPDHSRKVSVVGTSYGGFVAYHMARAMGPERVEKVVIASSDVLKSADDDKKFLERAGVEKVPDVMLPKTTENLRKLISLAVYRPPRFVPDFLLRDILRNLFSDKVEEKLELMNGITVGNKDEFQLSPLPQEVMIIWGDHDMIFPVNKAFELKKQLGERAKLEIVKDTGHLPQIENSDLFNEVLLNFLLGAPKSSM